MAAKLNNLTIPRLGAGNHSDGGGLYLRVIGQSRTWAFRYQRQGKTHWVSLGRVSDFSLAEARHKARECRRKLHDGVDVAGERKAARTPKAPGITFGEAAVAYIAAFQPGWKPKQAAIWRTSLDQHAAALLPIPVADVNVQDVMAVLRPIWATKNETASKVRGRIAAVLDYAKAQAWRSGDNSADWRGRLEFALPNRAKVAPVVHRAALPWQDLPGVMVRLSAAKGAAPRCTALLILTAVRSAEARGARWAEIDEASATWTLPPSRMKGAREHRIPLAPGVLAILVEMRAARPDGADLIFPGGRKGRPLTDVAVSKALHAAARRRDVTVHGCRSTFRDWCGEAMAVPGEVAEAALAHRNPDKTQRAYARSDLLDRRRDLMAAWAAYCTGVPHSP